MKKTMFITSVIMVVVMAIALTTSSLAWFTAAGQSTVTTNALQISAKATTSAGLQISVQSANGLWSESVELDSAVANMIPAELYTGAEITGYTENDYTDDDVAVATVLDALVGETFISNTIDSNGYFRGTAVTENANDANLYYSKDLWISSVDTNNAKKVQVAVNFTSDGSTAYSRAATGHGNDPILYVAVLAAKTDSVEADRDTAALYRDWEIIGIFNSGALSYVNLGDDADHYANGAQVSSRLDSTPAISDLITSGNKTTVALNPITTDVTENKLQSYGSSRQFKIVAWYDGTSLINANSSNFSLYFDCEFTAVANS